MIETLQETVAGLQRELVGFVPRQEQRAMAYAIYKALTEPDAGVIICEAGTGVGKSLGYMLGAIPCSLEQGKSIVISTATIALQEQLFKKDLPLFASACPVEFSYALAKGRDNYVCKHRLYGALTKSDEALAHDMGDESDEQESLRKENELLSSLYAKFKSEEWDGSRDSFGIVIPKKIWSEIASDRHTCSGPLHSDCPFQQARSAIRSTDVIIVNHSLLLADFMLQEGGGSILPDPADTVYIFDEAHHLPEIAKNSNASKFTAKGFMSVLRSLNEVLIGYRDNENLPWASKEFEQFINRAQDVLADIPDALVSLARFYEANEALFEDDIYLAEVLSTHEVDLFRAAHVLLVPLAKTLSGLVKLCNKMKDTRYDLAPYGLSHTAPVIESLEQLTRDCSFYSSRTQNALSTLDLLVNDNYELTARWVKPVKVENDQVDYQFNASPVLSNEILGEMFWPYVSSVVMTSATISALNSLALFRSEVGAPEHVRHYRWGSPFNYQQSKLYLPSDGLVDPSDQDGHTRYLIEHLFEDFIRGQKASLVLFSSYWQMNAVSDGVMVQLKEAGYKMLVQGEMTKAALLEQHAENVRNGIPSVLFGAQTLSEGLDLSGELLENLIITKVPFAMPTDPVSKLHVKDIRSRGGNPFTTVTLAAASRALTQSVGRLIRTERDRGRVIILDSRLVNARYGKMLVDALPPFERVFDKPELCQ